jgi:hypothetical protein
MSGTMLSIQSDEVILVGDLHGDLRALCRVLREAGCFRASPMGSSHAEDRREWRRLDEMCSACPVGKSRKEFPDPALLRAIHHAPSGGKGSALLFLGDVIDNRRPGVAGDDHGWGICAYSDSVERVIETVSRLCMQSPRGAVTWLIGNHDLWPLLQSCRQCPQYAPFHQCALDGSYSPEFRQTLINAMIASRAQAVIVANGVLCCHGGLNARFVQEAIRHTPEQPTDSASARKLMLQTINREFDSILSQAAASPEARLPAVDELGRFSWCLRPDSPLWCRPQADPGAFDALFRRSTYPPMWQPLAEGLAQFAYACAHTLQPHGVSVACASCKTSPKPVSHEEERALKPGELLYVDTGMSRGFGREGRIIQVARVTRDGRLRVTKNLA